MTLNAYALPRTEDIEDIKERILEKIDNDENEESEENEELEDLLDSYHQNPLNLNNATNEDLESLGILSNTQVRNFFEHISKTGPLISIYELQAIPEFDLDTIYLLLPFVTVPEVNIDSRNTSFRPLGTNSKTNFLLMRYERVIEWKKGYRKSKKTGKKPYLT